MRTTPNACPRFALTCSGPCQPSNRRGFTLAEALVAMAVASLAASSLLLATYTAMFHVTDGHDRMLADGLARQVMNEIVGWPYREKGTSHQNPTLGPESEPGRSAYDDIDDYAGFTSSPAADRWNVQLGQGDDAGGQRDAPFRLNTVHFSNWRINVSVHYVAENDWMTNLPPGNVSDFRAVEVVVSKTEQGVSRELARLRRVVAYVPN